MPQQVLPQNIGFENNIQNSGIPMEQNLGFGGMMNSFPMNQMMPQQF